MKNAKIHSSVREALTTVLILFFLPYVLTVMSGFAQGDISSEFKSDQNLKSAARVNPSTLALEFSLPLGSYQGRNGNSIPIVMTYSSKLWETKMVNSDYTDTGATYQTRTIEDYKIAKFMFSRRNFAGWSLSLQPPKIVRSNSFFLERPDSGLNFFETQFSDEGLVSQDSFLASSFQQPGGTQPQCYSYFTHGSRLCTTCYHPNNNTNGGILFTVSCYQVPDSGGTGRGNGPVGGGTSPTSAIAITVFRVNIQMPDGSIAEFRKDDKKLQCGFSATGTSSCTGAANVDGTYLSVDGSRMRFERNELQANGQKRNVLYLPNGSRYLFPLMNVDGTVSGPPNTGEEAVEFIDVDGNRTQFDRTSRTWLDTMGRSISNPIPPTSNYSESPNPTVESTQSIELPALPNSDRQAQLIWKKLKATGCETDTTGNCGESVLENPAQELRHIGSETCGAGGWTNNSNQPSLFQGTEWTDSSVPSIVKNYKENVCGNEPGMPSVRFNPVVLKEVILPDGKKYVFRYNIYGEISKIVYPTGAIERFAYGPIQPMGYDMADTFDKANRGVVDTWVYQNEQTLEQHWEYSAELIPNSNGPAAYRIKTTAPDGSYSERFIHRTHDRAYGFSNAMDGTTYEERSYAAPDASGVKRLARRTLTEWTQDGPLPGGYSDASRDARPLRTIAIVFEGDKILATMSETEYENPVAGSELDTNRKYFARLNPIRSKTHHYLSLTSEEANAPYATAIVNLKNRFHSASQLAGVSETDYKYDAQYLARGIPSLPAETRVLNPQNTSEVLSKSQVAYDETGTYFSMDDEGSTVGYVPPSGSGAQLKGKPTTTRTWNRDTNSWIEVHRQFDNFGNLGKVWDLSGDTTRFVETEYTAETYFAYPKRKITPAPDPTGVYGTDEGSSATTSYDLDTGIPLSVTDSNGQTTTFEYDSELRPIRVIPPSGGAITESEYGDTPGNHFVKTRSQIDETNWAESTTFYDNLGRPLKAQGKDAQGDVFTEVEYDSFGRVARSSNPYRAGEQKFWSKPRYDELGRVVETFAPAPDGQTGASNGIVEFGISTVSGFIGNFVVSTDASGRKSRALKNVYGQLVRLDEATGNNELGTLANPNQPTFYHYNIEGELVRVEQGQQNRYFKYDSLGRLTRVRQPEQMPNPALATTGDPVNNEWTAGFTYDIHGNLITATDAKNTVITNQFDKAGRLVKKTYSDGTPQIEYFFDGKGLPQIPQFAKGQLTKVTSSVSESRYTGFDNLGRLLASQQITDGQTYNFAYTYNVSGGLVEQTYPSGRVVRNHLETDGGLKSVSSKAANGQFRNYASNFDYSAAGGLKSMMLGNGRWENAEFNSRLQLTQIGLGNAATDTSLWKLAYQYGELNQDGVNVDENKNVGQIAKQTVTVPGASFTQTFKYDSLFRLTEAKETSGTNQNWAQTFGYDRFGNRTSLNQTIGSAVSSTTPTVDPATNRFTTGQGFVYDLNGNLIQDAENRGFTFNGDDKQTVVRNLNIPAPAGNPDANVVGRYYYDGEGARVKKVTNTETTIFVYDGFGALAAEYSTTIAAQPTISYLTTDHLGSPRVVTDRQGNVTSRRDFLPFGEEISAGIGARTFEQKYSAVDSIRQRFTGYEKDNETDMNNNGSGLDFAEARMYQSKHGRFTAADPLLSSASLGNPQTFNRYVYVGNNPVNITDPLGLIWCRNNETGKRTNGHKQCPAGSTHIADGTAEENIGENNMGIPKGSTIVVYDNDTYIVRNQNTRQEDNDGARVQGESDPVSTNTGDVGIQSPVGQRTVDNLPPCPTEVCGSKTPFVEPRLDTKNTEPLETVATIEKVSDAGGNIPGLNIPFTIIKTVIDIGQGDFSDAGSNSLSLIPGLKTFRTVSKAKPVFDLGQKLFNSKLFGKDSLLFGNKLMGKTNVSGILNRGGSFLKVGWSGVNQEMNIKNARYLNGLILPAKVMKRSSFTGGGKQLRITIGKGTGQQGRWHFYIPRTFLPDSLGNR